ncbi:ATP-binding protein [Dyadobacter subterraneus]|uniref:histidine kinase n=1 Tax=Dyadobacter subterraneus TaxID=2773304 RepID=A0ABR9W8P6_9BACT|nr:hypothetical protein [Dyadobacter subterraneus]
MFELFHRSRTRNQYEGTGIGLAICKKLLSNHGGFISAQSDPGVGYVSNIFLPYQL